MGVSLGARRTEVRRSVFLREFPTGLEFDGTVRWGWLNSRSRSEPSITGGCERLRSVPRLGPLSGRLFAAAQLGADLFQTARKLAVVCEDGVTVRAA